MKRFLCVLFGVLFFVSMLLVPAYAADRFAEKWVPGDKASAAENYWTAERMKNAKPYRLPAWKRTGHRAPADPAEEVSGPAGVDPGNPGLSAPRPEFDISGRKGPRTAVDALETATLDTVGYNYPPPQTTFPVPELLYGTLLTPYPYRTVGKIFFTEAGKNYVCSGASIGGKAVLTAGHCVSDGKGTYHSNWVFVPSYKEGTEPYGRWPAFWLATFPEYHKGGDMGRDVAFAAVNDKLGVSLSTAVGYLGFAYNFRRIQHWNAFGYPAGDPWDGGNMVETQASYAYDDDRKTPKTIGIGTTQTGGCSGGPWILKFKPGVDGKGINLANGVNSYSLEDDGEIYSPYFDEDVKALKDKAVDK